MMKWPTLKRSFLIIGNNQWRILKAVISEGVPKISAMRMETCPFFTDFNPPASEVSPTMNREYVVAVTTSSLSRYTRMGTVRMDPPAPSMPSERPTTNAAMYASISKLVKLRGGF